ncbi:transcriptional regulator [Mycobacterium lehmannii]|uniref:transcriptional regulator n=1 Tax=Mycobacterium lehmannii TaxID=2048550 RepID=UPI000B93FEFC|nr:transcriptional regulator [Mycobacterium lehmannii]
MATPRLVDLIDQYKNTHGVSDAELARRIGITRENLRLWRTNGVRRLPERLNLASVARTIGRPYRQVLSAALFDTGYLTDSETATPRPYDEVLYDAISVLTEASRLTNQPMRQASSGQWEPDPDPRAALPIDWAAFVTEALAGAAANAGGIDAILSGRPGSWEAAVVGDALRAAVGHDEWDLWRHRTEPVVIDLWVESILRDTNDTTYDDYQEAEEELSRREHAIPEPDDLPPGPFSPDDPRIAAVDWISVDDNGYLIVEGKAGWGDDPADVALLTELHQEAGASAPPHRPATAGEIAYDEAHEAITALRDALTEQERREYTDYAERLTVAVQARLAALKLPTPATVNITLASEGAGSNDFDDHSPVTYPRNAIEAAIDDAITSTPTPSALPGTPLDRLGGGRT